MDLSHLDKKYFIDPFKYNCPFCKRNHVSYFLEAAGHFNWSENKICYVYLVQCASCEKSSLHFSFEKFIKEGSFNKIYFANDIDIDSKLFFSQPSSSFVLDNRIPKKIRDLIFESEKCRQANFLVGSSACIRKAIYELLEHEKKIVKNEKTGHADYQKSIKALKQKFPNVAPDFFDALGDIQEMASEHVHEGSWQEWDSNKLRFFIELIKATLHEIYVIPEERKDRLSNLNQIKSDLKNFKKQTKEKNEANQI